MVFLNRVLHIFETREVDLGRRTPGWREQAHHHLVLSTLGTERGFEGRKRSGGADLLRVWRGRGPAPTSYLVSMAIALTLSVIPLVTELVSPLGIAMDTTGGEREWRQGKGSGQRQSARSFHSQRPSACFLQEKVGRLSNSGVSRPWGLKGCQTLETKRRSQPGQG